MDTLIHTPKGNLQRPSYLTGMSLDCGRKPEYPERTHGCTGRTCKLHAERPPARSRTFLLQGNSATNCATVQPGEGCLFIISYKRLTVVPKSICLPFIFLLFLISFVILKYFK
ncbi:hypothetical protein CRENBAI_019524 [Crenichthys baileyi]|uniref:Uncharacterized protein n=1 Tax=Crenichthys baileyi TaxID=28760 RepID=A0AAV9QT99_9TELE